MLSNLPSRLAKLLALCLLAACSDPEETPAPITRLLFPTDAAALVVLRGEGGTPSLHAVSAAGAVTPVGRVGEGIRLPLPILLGLDEDRIEHVWNPLPGGLVPISADAFALGFGGADDPRNRPEVVYARATALVARDGALTMLPVWADPSARGELQADAAGTLYFADLPVHDGTEPLTTVPPALRPIAVVEGVATLDWPISYAGDRVTSYAVDDEGNVGYRAERTDVLGPSPRSVGVLRPVVGAAPTWPVAAWPAPEDLGSFWRGADGKLYVTRTAAGDPATTELLRIDFGLDTVATPIGAWAGAPGLLDGEPFALGDARAFVRADEVVVLPPGGAPPEVHPLGFAHRTVRASAGALWLVTEPSTGEAARLVRWEPGAPRPYVETLLDDAYDVDEVAPYDDFGALVGVARRSDGARLLLRVVVGETASPIDTGIPRPVLADGLLLPRRP